MKKLLPFLMSFATLAAIAQTPCQGGTAGGYPCSGYDLQSNFTLAQLGAGAGNDSWGWVDPDDGSEYALIGLNNGTAFINITDPNSPVYLGKLPTHSSNSSWRDIKVYNNHAFVVSEASNHGMQVFDLTRLRNVASPPETFTEDAHYNNFGRAHNIIINEASGYAYVVGGDNAFGGGPEFINIQDPLNPMFAGGYSGGNYTHDAEVVIYDGPDTDYTGREIFFGSNENQVVIVDVTDKSAPVGISTISYTNVSYTHQGWFADGLRYFLVGDEADELDFGFNTRTIVLDLNDLDNPQHHFDYYGVTQAIDHNGYVVGDKYYLANYRSGIRVLDISDIANQNMSEIGFFDTYPANNNAQFDGAWNVYPFFPSGNIVISDIDRGFFLVKESAPLSVADNDDSSFSLSPNPSKNNITIKSTDSPISQVAIFNTLGQRVLNFDFSNSISENINISSLNSGLYLVKINNLTTKRLLVN
jgi:choice-of-anchor B domain-containing protein